MFKVINNHIILSSSSSSVIIIIIISYHHHHQLLSSSSSSVIIIIIISYYHHHHKNKLLLSHHILKILRSRKNSPTRTRLGFQGGFAGQVVPQVQGHHAVHQPRRLRLAPKTTGWNHRDPKKKTNTKNHRILMDFGQISISYRF
jgi:hypothetical protein